LILALDIDGVCIDGRPQDGKPWWTDLQADLGLPVETLQDVFFKPHWPDIFVGRKPMRPSLDDALRKVPGAPSADQLIEYWFRNDARLVPEAIDLMHCANDLGCKVVFATNQEALRANDLMERLGLAAYADRMFFSADIGVAKPDAGFFMHITNALNIAPSEMLFVDDHVANVETAKALGWRGVHVSCFEDLQTVRKMILA